MARRKVRSYDEIYEDADDLGIRFAWGLGPGAMEDIIDEVKEKKSRGLWPPK